MSFKLMSPRSKAAAARRRNERASTAVVVFFQTIHHKKKGWMQPADLKLLLRKVLGVKISNKQFDLLMSTPLYQTLFGRNGAKRVSLKQLKEKIIQASKQSVRIPRKDRINDEGSVSGTRAHFVLKECFSTSCIRELYQLPIKRKDNYQKPVQPGTFGKKKPHYGYDVHGTAADTLDWRASTGTLDTDRSHFSRSARTSYGRRRYDMRDRSGGGAKGTMDWDNVSAAKMTADQAQEQVAHALRLHFKNIRSAFRKADTDKDGTLSPRELRCMLTRLGISVSDQEYTKFLAKYQDVLDDGKIDFREFADKFGPKQDAQLIGNSKSKVFRATRTKRFSSEQALALLQAKMCDKFRSVTTAFLAADSNHDGSLSWPELRQLLERWQINMRDAEFTRLVQIVIKSFGAGASTQSVTLNQFKKSVLGAAVAAGTDQGILGHHKSRLALRQVIPGATSLPGIGCLDLAAKHSISPRSTQQRLKEARRQRRKRKQDEDQTGLSDRFTLPSIGSHHFSK